jgi:hypothetical protein
MSTIYYHKIRLNCVVEKYYVWGLFKNVQMQGAQKTESRGVLWIYVERFGLQPNTANHGALQGMSAFINSPLISIFGSLRLLEILLKRSYIYFQY